MSFFRSPKDERKPLMVNPCKPVNPLDCPVTLRDLICSEIRIIKAIHAIGNAGGDLSKLSDATANLKAQTDELQKSIDSANPT